jgi:DNA-binding YbaB/EbfC family protein
MKIPGGGGLQRQLMKQIEKMQEELEAMRIEGSAGGGVVTAVANGSGELIELKISPEAVDPNDVEMLQDLVLAAVRDALDKSRQIQQDKMGGVMGGMGLGGLF